MRTPHARGASTAIDCGIGRHHALHIGMIQKNRCICKGMVRFEWTCSYDIWTTVREFHLVVFSLYKNSNLSALVRFEVNAVRPRIDQTSDPVQLIIQQIMGPQWLRVGAAVDTACCSKADVRGKDRDHRLCARAARRRAPSSLTTRDCRVDLILWTIYLAAVLCHHCSA
jgi:hypothetical protein